MAPGYRSPDLLRYSQTVIGWLTDPPPHALAAQVAGWDDDAWETARWAIQVHGIGPLLHATITAWPDADVLHPRLRSYLADQHRLSG